MSIKFLEPTSVETSSKTTFTLADFAKAAKAQVEAEGGVIKSAGWNESKTKYEIYSTKPEGKKK